MEYIKKDEALEAIQKFIDVREDKNCSKQAIIEKQVFKYAKEVINKLQTYEYD